MRTLTVIFFLILITPLFGQTIPAENSQLISKITSSDINNDGSYSFSIPLYKIPVGNLSLESQMNYKSLGLIPTTRESIYGHNWMISPFGQILASHDDMLGPTRYFPDSRKIDCPVPESNLPRGISKYQSLYNPVQNGIKFFKSTKFYFDFFGYSGYFMFDNNRNPLVFCEQGKLEITTNLGFVGGLNCYDTSYNSIPDQEIIIFDDKGNRFYFGGSFDSMEINYLEHNSSVLNERNFGSRSNYVVSWLLKKVEVASGDVITANYRIGNKNVFSKFLEQNIMWDNPFVTPFPSTDALNNSNVVVTKNYTLYMDDPQNLTTNIINTKRAILESIEVPNKDIRIEYMYYKDGEKDLIKEIKIHNFGKSSSTKFKLEPLGGNYKRYFLTGLQKDKHDYIFEYYKVESLPSNSIGHGAPVNSFGYFDGGGEGELFDIGLLKKITYPTKGSENFIFEKGEALKIYHKPLIKEFFEIGNIDAINSSKGIPRLLSRKSFDGLTSNETRYTYLLDDGKSSGIVNGNYNTRQFVSSYGSTAAITYSQIQENQVVGISELFFTDFVTHPFQQNLKNFSASGFNNLSSRYFVSNDEKRGKLRKKILWNVNKEKVRETQYEYENFIHNESDLKDLAVDNCTNCKLSDLNYYVFTIVPSEKTAATMYVPVLPYLLKNEKTTEYFVGKQIEQEISFEYLDSNIFWHPYPIEIRSKSTTGNSIKKFIYPWDLLKNAPKTCYRGTCVYVNDDQIIGGQFQTYSSMISANVFRPIIEIDQNNSGKFSLKETISKSIYPFNPERYNFSDAQNSISFDNFTTTNIFSTGTIDLYDNRSNVIQRTSESGIPTAIIWGYKQTRPIAKIEGATYSQISSLVEQIISDSNVDLDVLSEKTLITALDNFRKDPLVSNYLVTTYTYDPLIGVTSITPPSGVREYYFYDNAERLQYIKDVNNNIMKEFEYNYKK